MELQSMFQTKDISYNFVESQNCGANQKSLKDKSLKYSNTHEKGSDMYQNFD